MGIKYNPSITVNWGELLFILERRYNTSLNYYQGGVEKLADAKEQGDLEQFHFFAKDTFFNSESVLSHARLANSVRRFIGLEPRFYDLASVREMRLAMREILGHDNGGAKL